MIGDITSAAAASAANTASAAGGLGALGGEAFLNLMVTQLRYQNPMAPSDPSAMMQQTATFTQVETMQKLAALQQQMLGLQRATMAADMVGKEVTVRGTDGADVTGTVDGVRFTETGPLLRIGDQEFAVESVEAFGTTAAPAAPPATPAP
jgi:flagellar basal-body rod modification protein FlgD